MNESLYIQLMIFVGAFMLLFVLLYASGQKRHRKKNLNTQLDKVRWQQQQGQAGEVVSLRRETYLHGLSRRERKLESLPGMESLRHLIEQSGQTLPAYKLAGFCLLLACAGFLVTLLINGQWWLGLIVGFGVSVVPIAHLIYLRQHLLDAFEEQLPEALDAIARSLRAGHPFTEAMKLIGQEMQDPIAREFAQTSAELSYGMDFRQAMMNLQERIPSMSLRAAIVAILIQRETGGNLSETIGNISNVIRGRFQLQRKIKTLSAEGRLSAKILILMPFSLMLMIQFINPDYLIPLFKEEAGHKLLIGGGVFMLFGVFWIRQIIKLDY